MKKVNITLKPSIITFIIGTLIGSGAIWQWQKFKIDKITTTTELRVKRSRLLEQIISLSNEFMIAKDSYDKSKSSDTHIKTKQLETRLDILKNDFEILERKLSSLENRLPDKIQIDFIVPLPPMNFRLRHIQPVK